MNNMMFTLCRYLRDNGFDTHLFLLNDEPDHFLPVADSYDRDFESYTTTLNIGKDNFFNADIRALKKLFRDINFFIGTDIAPAILSLIGKKLDVFIPHGSDICAYPFATLPPQNASRIWWLRSSYFISFLQKIGIENAGVILFPDEYEVHSPFKSRLNCKGKFENTSGPMLYVPQYHKGSDSSVTELQHYSFFNNLREKHDLIIFSHSRHNGYNLEGYAGTHMKGHDVLLNGFKKFIDAHPSCKACLVFYEYGMNVNASKELVSELGLDRYVYWMPKMYRKEIMYGLAISDIGCGEFCFSWLTCGVVNETLALGKPLLHYRNDELYKKDYTVLYPVINVRTSDQVFEQIEHFVNNKEKVKEESRHGIQWIEENTVVKPLEIILERIRLKKKAENLSFGLKIRVFYSKLKVSGKVICRKAVEKLGIA